MPIASSLLNVCRFNPTAGGTTDWTYASIVTGYQSPAAAGAVNGNQYSYRAESADLSQWEIGIGIYNAGVLTRAAVLFNSAGTTAKINFSTVPQVAFIALAEDVMPLGPPQGRLTLVSGSPVVTSAQNNKTTLYFTPYGGSRLPLYDGVSWRMVAFSELSIATTDTTKNPAAIGASKVNDWFVWNDAGTPRLSHGPDWTNDTTRSAGTVLVSVNGILMNSVAITNGPAASRGVYVGTTRSNASSQLDFSFGGSSAGGTPALLNVWNMYNRVTVGASVTDTTGTWNYTSNVVRMTNNSAGNRINFVTGLAEDAIPTNMFQRVVASTAAGVPQSGFGLDSATAFTTAFFFFPAVAGAQSAMNASNTLPPQLGAHFIQALEVSDGAVANTWVGGTYEALSASFRV